MTSALAVFAVTPIITAVAALALSRRRVLRMFVVGVVILASWILLIDRVDRESAAAYEEEEASIARGDYVVDGPRSPPGTAVFLPVLFGWMPATLVAALVIVPQWITRNARARASAPGGFAVGTARPRAG
jgi:hypothetical protein